ncbi:MAG: V-type ATP synthase subunit E family protein [Trueperaceae bacterium]|nr:V-type ATP synthase subunit E family protein [Trueperaceae bacterium]
MSRVLGDLDGLIARVRRRAEQRALAREASSEEEARRIQEEGQQRAEHAREAILAQGRRDAAEAKRRRLATAELERKQRMLEAREARIEQAFTAAQAALEEHTFEAAYADTLARLARQAARELGGDTVVVQLDPTMHARCSGEEVAAWAEEDGPALQRAAEPLQQGRGLVARSGRASVDATFANRLEGARTRLRGEVEARLAARASEDTPDGRTSR